MNRHPHVVIIGAGAIGGYYGAILKRAGCSVSVVLRSSYDAVVRNGLVVRSPQDDLSYRPDFVYQDGATAAADDAPVADYVLLCVKVLPRVDRAELVRPWMGTGTRLVVIENGIDIEPEMARAYPNTPVISCLVYLAASMPAPGEVSHSGRGWLVAGCFPDGVDARCRELVDLIVAGGGKADVSEAIVGERWRKCVWNTSFNSLSALAHGADTRTMLETPGGVALVRALMLEVCAVARADGYPLDEHIVDQNIAATRDMPAIKTSMAQDYLRGRAIELDAIVGNVVAIAQRHGVAVPRLQTILTALRIRGF